MRDYSERRYILTLTEQQYLVWERLRVENGLGDFHELISLGIDVLVWISQERKGKRRQTRGRLKAMIRRR